MNGLKQERGASGPDAVAWKGDDISYRAAHKRIANARGKAADYECDGCGERAEHWAYDGKDENEKWAYFEYWDREVPYSTDVNRYRPLCRGCHVKVDRYGWALQ